MTTQKVALSISAEVLAAARRRVKDGRARSLSAFVTKAVDEKLRRDELSELLDALDRKHGAPDEEARAWARNVVARSS